MKRENSCHNDAIVPACRYPLPEPGPPAPGLPGSAGSALPATDSRPAGALPAAQDQRLLAAQPLPQF